MKYIGNKTRLLGFIEASLSSASVPKAGVFADVFAGTGSVGQHFKQLGYEVHSNDFMTYSYVLQQAIIQSNHVPDFTELARRLGLPRSTGNAEDVLRFLNNLDPIKGYFFENYGAGGSAGRRYFTAENAGLIDAVREQIQLWHRDGLTSDPEHFYLLAALIDAADHVANMSGTYGAYLKIWRSVALKRLWLLPREVFDNRLPNKAYQRDANELVRELAGQVLYLDPPYNGRQYASNFHVLESLAVWDKQVLQGITGLRNYEEQKSDFSSKSRAMPALKQLVDQANFDVIALSYNNEGIIPHDEIRSVMSSFGKLVVYETDYRRFRTESDNERRRYKDVGDQTREFLFVAVR